MNIIEEIKEINKIAEVEVEFKYLNGGSNSPVNKALEKADSAKKLELTTAIFRSRYKWESESKEIFHENAFEHGILMFTLTANGEQFRAWIEPPASIRTNHVDSMGRGVLLGVYGDPEEVHHYVLSILGAIDWPTRPATLPNGVKIYINWK